MLILSLVDVESVGMYPAKDILPEAISVLRNKCTLLINELESM